MGWFLYGWIEEDICPTLSGEKDKLGKGVIQETMN